MLSKLIIKFSWVSQPLPSIQWSQAPSKRIYSNIFSRRCSEKWLSVPKTILKSNSCGMGFSGKFRFWSISWPAWKKEILLSGLFESIALQLLLILMEMHYLFASDNLTELSPSSSLVQSTFAMWLRDAFPNCLQIFFARQRTEIFSLPGSFWDGDTEVVSLVRLLELSEFSIKTDGLGTKFCKTSLSLFLKDGDLTCLTCEYLEMASFERLGKLVSCLVSLDAPGIRWIQP